MEWIYVIIQGSYSDWRIKGYALTGADAKATCDTYNKKNQDKYQEEWYYQPVRRIETATEEYRIYKKHCVRVYPGNDGVFFDSDFSEDVLLKDVPTMEVEQDGNGSFINVCLEDEDGDRAEKIAQDFWYKHLAEVKIDGMD